MHFDNIETVSQVLTSAVADTGTYTAEYPDGTDAGSFAPTGHTLTVAGAVLQHPADFTLTFGTSNITVTNASGASWPADATVRLGLKQGGDHRDVLENNRLLRLVPLEIILGEPDTADPNGVCESQSGAAGALTLNGALVSGGVATFDVPRNIVIDSGGVDTATLTITGTDEYGNTVVEDITLNGTTAVAGKKAFKTVTGVVSDATISNGAFVGTGDVLGLPVFIPSTGAIIAELEDGADASAGTVVAGVTTEATATTGDVRGTYDPNTAMDGSTEIRLYALVNDPTFKGIAQFAG